MDLDDRRIDLSETLRINLQDADRNRLEVATFTDLDRDHLNRMASFFCFDHAKKHQETTA